MQTELLVPFQASRTVATEDEQPELLIPFVTFHTAAVKEAQTELIIPFLIIRTAEKEEEQMELFIPFWTIHAAETSFERNSSLRGGLRPMSTRSKDLEVYFQIDPTSSSDSFGAKNYRQNDV